MAPEPAASRRTSSQEAAEVRIGWKMAGIGMTVASEVAAGALLGFLYDLWRGSGRTGIIVGSLVGIAVGLWTLISQTLKLNRQLDILAPTRGRGRPIPPEEYDDDRQDQDDR